MAFTNFDTKEINCKVIYFGPPSSGKTANLRSILQLTSAEIQNNLWELGQEPGPTQFFDFLPISLGNFKEYSLKLHLFTLPTNPLWGSVPSVVLRGVDGFIFVADSRLECLADNSECLEKTRRILLAEGYMVADMPCVMQYNKRDATDAVPVEILREELNPGKVPDCEAIATQGIGTMEALQNLTKQLMKRLGQPDYGSSTILSHS